MRLLKIWGWAMMATIFLICMVGVGTASATALYSGANHVPAGTEVKATLSGSSTLATTEGTILDTCSGGSISGSTANTGNATEAIKVPVIKEKLSWSGCTESTATTEGGELEVHWVSGTTNGTLTAKGFKVEINTTIFGKCVYTAGGSTDIGTLTGKSSGTAIMDISAVLARFSGLCPPTGVWTANYTITAPDPLAVERERPVGAILYSGISVVQPGTEVKADLGGSTHATTTGGEVRGTCTTGSMKGKTTNTGTPTEPVKIVIEAKNMTWGACTDPTTTLTGGELEIRHAVGTTNGTVTAKGFEILMETQFGKCVYSFPVGTSIGTLTGSSSGTAEIDIDVIMVRKTGLCSGSTLWAMSYLITGPDPLAVEGT